MGTHCGVLMLALNTDMKLSLKSNPVMVGLV